MTVKEHITRREQEVADCRARLAREAAVLGLFKEEELERLVSVYASHYGADTVTLFTVTKDEPILRRALARIAVDGKATKQTNASTYDPGLEVVATLASGEIVKLPCQIPASCHIVEEEVEVPANFVAAYTKTRRRVVCTEED